VKTAVGYTRLSQRSDASIERQQEHIHEYANQHDFHLGRIYDDGQESSGFTIEREEYQELTDLIELGSIDAIIVNDIRRLARDYDASLELVLTLRRNDIEVHTWQDGQKNFDDPMASSFEIIKAAAEYESKMKEIERAKEAVNEKLERGDAFGQPPYGFRYSDDKRSFEPDPEEWPSLREALEQRLVEEDTLASVEKKTGVTTSTLSRTLNDRLGFVSKHVDDIDLLNAIEDELEEQQAKPA